MPKYNQLSISDRFSIENGITKGYSFKKIAKDLGRNASSITREILKNRTHIEPMHHFSNDCVHAPQCSKTHLCGNETCPFPCKWCRKEDILGKCCTRCPDYHSIKCYELMNPPYVCNNCQMKDRCIKEKYFYAAKDAEQNANTRRSMSRRGPHANDEQLAKMDKLLNDLLVEKNQSLAHIIAEHPDEFPISERTAYIWIDRRYFTARNIDLRRKVGMRPRRYDEDPNLEGGKRPKADRAYKKGRTYADYNDYVVSNSDYMVCEMDTVIGKQSDKKRIPTLFLRRYSILLIFVLRDGKAATVREVFDLLQHKLGIDCFRRIFPIILTDNGAEFQQPESIELDWEGEYRTNVYYCNPMCSWQKGAIEKAHEFIRYIIPKGQSFTRLEQEDFTLIMNHINSYKRKSLGGLSPYETIHPDDKDMQLLMEVLKLKLIPADNVKLKPSLLKR